MSKCPLVPERTHLTLSISHTGSETDAEHRSMYPSDEMRHPQYVYVRARACLLLSERTEGWDPMCRYSYRSGACANRHVESLECLGEENCQHSQVNILFKKGSTGHSQDCGLDKWLGLYCEKHGRIFCSGKDGCETPELYMRHLTSHQESLSRRPQEE